MSRYPAPKEAPVRPRTTVSGRIVYNRRIHYFSAADALRIVRVIPAPDGLTDYLRIVQAIYFLGQRLMEGLATNFIAVHIMWNTYNTVKEVLLNIVYMLQRELSPDSPQFIALTKVAEALSIIM